MRKKIIVLMLIFLFSGCTENEFESVSIYIDGEITDTNAIVDNSNFYVDINSLIEFSGLEKSFFEERLEYRIIDDVEYVNLDEVTKQTNFEYTVSSNELNITLEPKGLMDFKEALEIFEEGSVAKVRNLDNSISFDVRRVEGGFATIADVEPLTKEDTNKLFELAGGSWGHDRISIIVEINEKVIAASISPFPHSGRDDMPFGEIVDNRSGHTGRGINLNSVQDNDLNGVVDIYFYNSLTPGLNRVDSMHQVRVLESASVIGG